MRRAGARAASAAVASALRQGFATPATPPPLLSFRGAGAQIRERMTSRCVTTPRAAPATPPLLPASARALLLHEHAIAAAASAALLARGRCCRTASSAAVAAVCCVAARAPVACCEARKSVALAAAPQPAPKSGMAELAALVREHWAQLLAVALLTLASTLLKLMCTRRTGALYESIKRVDGARRALPVKPLATVLGLRLGEGVFRALQSWVWARAAARIETQLQRKAFATLLSTDMAALDLTHTSALAGHVAQDAKVATLALETLAFKGVRNMTSVVGGAAALASVSSDISLLALSMVPPATLLFVAVGQWSARLAKAAAHKAQAATGFASERLGAVRTVRLLAQEDAECDRYEGALGAVRKARDAHSMAHAVHVGLLSALPGMGMGIWLFAGSELVARGLLSVGALTTVVPLVLEVATAAGGLSRLHASLMHGADAAARLGALSAAPHAIEGASGVQPPTCNADGVPQGAVRGAVAFHDVSFAYPARPDITVVDRFSLQLAPGEIFAIVGASGSGKSTIAALLTRLYDVGAGSITIDGVDIRALEPRTLRRTIGVVSQEPVLFSGSIRENIVYASPDATSEALHTAATAANAHAFITALPLGYETLVGERGAQLSGGQRQRIAIARVLLLQPRILLLDEATSALDSESEKLVAQALQAASAGKTCFIIAHRLSTVRRADRIGVMQSGKLVEVGTHEQLMALRGAYWRLVESAVFRDDEKDAD